LAAEMIAELPRPETAPVVVLGDTAFAAKSIGEACAARKYTWVVPLHPERVVAGPQGKRPKVRSLVNALQADQLVAIRLHAGPGALVAQRRVRPWRGGSKVKPRTYSVHQRRQAVHSVGAVQLVFSTRTKPSKNQPSEGQKILMTNALKRSAKQIVEWDALRWQSELCCKELKSTLGFQQYRLRTFDSVEGWEELIQVTYLYLEWYRATQLRRRDLGAETKPW
jgi:hypothetical protein